MSAELNELAARVERLSGPDRGVDYLIFCATAPMDEGSHWSPEDRHHYTASLDAAMTLVPDRLRLMLSEWDDETHLRPRGPWQAVLVVPGCDSSFDLMRGYRCEHGATPAIALTAAALRARSQAASQ